MLMHSTRDNITNDFSVEVNFTGQGLDPAKVTEILGIEPIKTAKAGDPCRNGTSSYEEGIWAYEVSSNDEVTECRDHQLNCLIDKVEPRMAELREAGVERAYFYFTLSSFVGLMNIRFKAETLARLGSLDADLYVSCFDCFNPKHSIWQDGAAIAESPVDGQA